VPGQMADDPIPYSMKSHSLTAFELRRLAARAATTSKETKTLSLFDDDTVSVMVISALCCSVLADLLEMNRRGWQIGNRDRNPNFKNSARAYSLYSGM
jgi:hypothetical protein